MGRGASRQLKGSLGAPVVRAACARADGGAGGKPRSGRYGRVQWRSSVITHTAGNADVGGFDALGMVSGGSSEKGHLNKVRTGIVA